MYWKIFIRFLIVLLTTQFQVKGQENMDVLDSTYSYCLTTVESSEIDSLWLLDAFYNRSSNDYAKIQISDIEENHDFFIFGKLVTNNYINPALLLKADNTNFKIYLDGHLWFDSKNPALKDYRFFNYYILPIDTFSIPKILSWHCHYENIFDIGEISLTKIGNIEDMYKTALNDQRNFTKRSLFDFGVGSALILLGLFLIILFFFFKKETGLLLFFFSIFSLGVGLDDFFPFLEYYFSIPLDISSHLSTIWISLIAISLWGLINTISKKSFFALSGIMIGLNVLILIIVQFFLLEYILIIEYIIQGQILLAIITMIYEKLFKQKEFRFFVISTIIYLGLVVFSGYTPGDKDFSSIGALAVVLSLGMLSFQYYKQEKLKVDVFSQEIKFIKEQLNQLEIKNMEMQLEALKNQLNPHFLFNSLYALSALIKTNQSKATKFVEEFSDIFRYVLDSSDRTVVRVKKELDFIQSYIYLQKIRYQENLRFTVNVSPSALDYYLPPLSIQLLVENAIKHNEISDDFPLIIDIYIEESKLVVKNKVRKLINLPESKRVGLKNLKVQYDLITNREPEFIENADDFIVKLPLIREEE